MCVTDETAELTTCRLTPTVELVVVLVAGEEAFGVFGWIGIGFFPGNPDAEFTVTADVGDMPSILLPPLFKELSTVEAFIKLSPLDTGTDGGNDATV